MAHTIDHRYSLVGHWRVCRAIADDMDCGLHQRADACQGCVGKHAHRLDPVDNRYSAGLRDRVVGPAYETIWRHGMRYSRLFTLGAWHDCRGKPARLGAALLA